MSEKTKKPFKMPHTFVIIFTIILAAVALTWIIPAGQYVRFENAQGIEVIDPNQFNYIDRTPVNPFLIPLYIVKAFIKQIDLMARYPVCRRRLPHDYSDRSASRNRGKVSEGIL